MGITEQETWVSLEIPLLHDLSDQNFHCNKRNSTVLEPYTFDRIFRLLTLVINELTFKFISALCIVCTLIIS